MRSFQETFETRKQSFISAFSICMALPLTKNDVEFLPIEISSKKVRANTVFFDHQSYIEKK